MISVVYPWSLSFIRKYPIVIVHVGNLSHVVQVLHAAMDCT